MADKMNWRIKSAIILIVLTIIQLSQTWYFGLNWIPQTHIETMLDSLYVSLFSIFYVVFWYCGLSDKEAIILNKILRGKNGLEIS